MCLDNTSGDLVIWFLVGSTVLGSMGENRQNKLPRLALQELGHGVNGPSPFKKNWTKIQQSTFIDQVEPQGNPRTYKGGWEGMPPPEGFWIEDKTSGPYVFSSCTFIPRAHFETS